MRYESLHSHTVISDGRQTHLEVLKTAEDFGFGFVAFTDHDILPRNQELKQLKSYQGPVKWEIGIEISSGWPTDLGGGQAGMFHVLGLRIDQQNQNLQDYCRHAVEGRISRIRQRVKNFQALGFNLKLSRVMELAGPGAPASPHLVAALLESPENIRSLEVEAARIRLNSQHDQALRMAYEEMMFRVKRRGPKEYVYPMYLSETALIPGVYFPHQFHLPMDKCVKLIRDAGGVAIVAHWATAKAKIDDKLLRHYLETDRLDGIEVESDFQDSLTYQEETAILRRIAKQTGKLGLVVLDSHDADDFEQFVNIKGLAQQTVGQWQRIIDY